MLLIINDFKTYLIGHKSNSQIFEQAVRQVRCCEVFTLKTEFLMDFFSRTGLIMMYVGVRMSIFSKAM